MAKNQHNHQPFEATLQDLVYSVDAGTGLKIIRTVLYCLFFIGLAVIYTGREFRGFNNEAAMDYAQLGRNLAQTGRYITHCVRPFSIAQVSANTFNGDALIERHPELFRPPMYPAILAAQFKFYDLVGVNIFPNNDEFIGMRIYPAEQWVILPLHHFFTGMAGLMMYLLGKNLFSKKIALAGVTTYFLTNAVWCDSLLGTGIPVLVFFILSAAYFLILALVRRRERKSRWGWLVLFGLSILFSGAAFLTSYPAIPVIIGLALFTLLMGTKRQRSGHLVFFYLTGALLIASPWLMNNYRISGSPFGLALHMALAGTDNYPSNDSLVRTLNPEFNLLEDIDAVKTKWKKNFGDIYENNLTTLGGGLLIAFFMITFFYRFVRVSVHTLRWGIGLAMVLLLAGVPLFNNDAMRYYHIFLPFVILYGLSFFFVMLDRLDITVDIYKNAITWLVVGLNALPLFFNVLMSPPPGPVYPPYFAPFVMRVSELLRPNEVICSDMPWATAWYGKRLSILLPQTLDEYYEINDYRKYISGMYLTTLTKDKPFISSLLDGPEKTWFPIMMGRMPPDFPLKQGFALNKQDQLFLTDSIRWGIAPQQGEGGGEGGQPPAEGGEAQ
ncbi:MAG: glycosyltransferase family 39 protein [Kiritimatiellales bacterium]